MSPLAPLQHLLPRIRLKRPQRIPVLHLGRLALEPRSRERGQANALIIALDGPNQTLPSLGGKIEDEVRDVEAGDAPADVPLQVQAVAERRAQVLGARDDVALVDVVLREE
jgi:hypothetical protein